MRHITLIAGLAACGQLVAVSSIQESARKIPLVKETDVLVVGGSSGAVSAALAAKAAGADVYLVAPRPYLGEDIAGTLRLGLEDDEEPDTELAQELWLDRSTTVPFTYKADAPAVAPHLDKNRTVLSDGPQILKPTCPGARGLPQERSLQ